LKSKKVKKKKKTENVLKEKQKAATDWDGRL